MSFAARLARRWRWVGGLLFVQLVFWTALRLVLCTVFADGTLRWTMVPGVLARGVLFDLITGITSLLPVVVLLSVFRLAWLNRGWVRGALLFPAFVVLCFDLFVQYFFFEEYDARYNHLALDYLMYPDEVFGNIFASYNVPLVVGFAVLLGAGVTWAFLRWPVPVVGDWHWRDRLRGVVATSGLTVLLAGAWAVAPFSVGPTRTAGELTLNGWAELVRAYLTSHLDYDEYYALLPEAEALGRAEVMVGQTDVSRGLTRHFEPHPGPGAPYDVAILIEESLGSEFSTRFGGNLDLTLTPELDHWSHEGLALTNVIANGNRTVRGLEGVLCSFLPLPGDSIVKQDRSRNVATIARVLAADGYDTTFLYGGYGLFDNLESFMTANGYEAFVQQPDYPPDAFRTIWGVADEFVLDEMIARQKRANREGHHWLGTALTVSNHKPFKLPAGRVPLPDGESGRRKAVRYADWAIGRYLTRAREEGLLNHTVVLIVGDHGARVYGAEAIPVSSYRIPAVFLTPDSRYRDTVIDRLASQIDLAPTLLSLAGVAYDAPFFGEDLLGLSPAGGRAFVNHNRSIGLLTDSTLVVLGLHRSLAVYTRASRSSDRFTAVRGDAPQLRETARMAEAMFQTAYRIYMARQYTLPGRDGRKGGDGVTFP